MIIQESPPAWTREAYRPPRSHCNFLLFGGGGSLNQKFFSQSEHVSSQIWCQKFFPLLRLGPPPQKSETFGPPPENLRLGTPPQKIWDLGPPPENLRPGTPPRKFWDLGPPPSMVGSGTPAPLPGPGPGTPHRGVDWHTEWKFNLPSSFGCGR